MSKQYWIFHTSAIFLGISMYYFTIIGKMSSSLSILLAEIASLAICSGGIAILHSMHDENSRPQSRTVGLFLLFKIYNQYCNKPHSRGSTL